MLSKAPNVFLLVIELLRADKALHLPMLTDIYWMYQRVELEGLAVAKEVGSWLDAAWQKTGNQQPILPLLLYDETQVYTIHHDFWAILDQLPLDWSLLARYIYAYFPLELDALHPYIFKYLPEKAQKKLLPYQEHRRHTGSHCLNLGGFELGEFPTIILDQPHIQELYLWGNNLEVLPEGLGQAFPKLEVLNVGYNNLSSLPKDIGELAHLQKLHVQNNNFTPTALLQQIKTLPRLRSLAASFTTAHLKTQNQQQFQALEALVQHGKLQVSEQEQQLFLAFCLNEKTALMRLNLETLFSGLTNEDERIQKGSLEQLLAWKGRRYRDALEPHHSLAVLGILTFAAHHALEALEAKGFTITTKVQATTTHVLLGKEAEYVPELHALSVVFLTEGDLLN